MHVQHTWRAAEQMPHRKPSVVARQGEETGRKQVLSFAIGGKKFGVLAAEAKGVIRLPVGGWEIHASELVTGVAVVGTVEVPVLDLSAKMGLDPADGTRMAYAVIVPISGRAEVGIAVGELPEVLSLQVDDIRNIGGVKADVPGDCFLGIGRNLDDVVFVFDSRKLLTQQEVNSISAILAERGCGQTWETRGESNHDSRSCFALAMRDAATAMAGLKTILSELLEIHCRAAIEVAPEDDSGGCSSHSD